MAATWEESAGRAEQENWGYRRFLQHLCESEAQDRRERKMQRLLKDSGLPTGKTLGNLEENLLPLKIRRLLPTLLEGHFVTRAENVLAFGLPGRGKSHCLAALARELILRHGYPVLFTPTFKLGQQLLAAKQALKLAAAWLSCRRKPSRSLVCIMLRVERGNQPCTAIVAVALHWPKGSSRRGRWGGISRGRWCRGEGERVGVVRDGVNGEEGPLAGAPVHLDALTGEAALLPLHLDVPAGHAHELDLRLGGLGVGSLLCRTDAAEVLAVGLGVGGAALDAVDEAGGEFPTVATGTMDTGVVAGGTGGLVGVAAKARAGDRVSAPVAVPLS